MALVTDKDNLSQGTLTNVTDLTFGAPTSNQVTISSAGSNIPALADDEWFEIRGANTPGNDGLYRVNDATPGTDSITVDKFTGVNPVLDSTASSTDILGTTGASTEKSIMYDTAALKIYLFEQGNLSSDGATMLAIHSRAKADWKATDNYLMDRADFPIVGISFAAGQWQLGTDPSGNYSGWDFADDITAESQGTRKLVRNAGWDVLNSSGETIQKWANITTLPTSNAFEDTLDQAYYWFGTDNTDTGAPTNYVYTGEVNEAVQFLGDVGDLSGDTPAFGSTSTITRVSGDFTTDGFVIGCQVNVRNSTSNDGTYVLTNVEALTLTVSGTPLSVEAWGTTELAWDNSNEFTTALRIRDADTNGKTFGEADLAAGGETELDSKVVKLGLANATDLKISELDANITNSPYSEVRIRYLAGAYNREVDTTTKRNFGIVVDCGTYSNSNGSTSTTDPCLTSANFVAGVGEAVADYAGGTLIVHEGSDQGTYTITDIVDNAGTLEIDVSPDFSVGSETNISFTVQRATPLNVDYEDAFEKIQYQLRQASNINETGSTVVVGKTAGRLAVFEGDTMKMGSFTPTNPAGGGSGVIMEGFDANNTNDLKFTDNTGTEYNYPFVSAGNIVANQGLVDDTDGEFWLYFEYTDRTTSSDIDVTVPGGSTYTLTGTLPNMAVGDYIRISGFAQEENNGVFIVDVENTPSASYDVRRYDGGNVGTAETNQTVNIDENPYWTPHAILVQDNDSNDIAGDVNALQTPFTFDYEGNTQGGRTADTVANVVLIASGAELGQYAVVKNLQITKTTGLTFSITSALERNYLA